MHRPRQVAARWPLLLPSQSSPLPADSQGFSCLGNNEIIKENLASLPHDLTCAFKAPYGTRNTVCIVSLLEFALGVFVPSSSIARAIPPPQSCDCGSIPSCQARNSDRSRGFAPPQRFTQLLFAGLLHPATRYGVRRVAAPFLRIVARPKANNTRKESTLILINAAKRSHNAHTLRRIPLVRS